MVLGHRFPSVPRKYKVESGMKLNLSSRPTAFSDRVKRFEGSGLGYFLHFTTQAGGIKLEARANNIQQP